MHDEIVHKPKAVEFGDTIVYDAERCIVCTRCVRFMEEIAHDPVLSKRERGNLSEIVVSPGRKLEGHYTMMTDEVCPVGALTTKDFRFKARVWFLRRVPTVCPGCATGCNAWLEYDPRTGEVPRLRPRDNEKVNKHWLCDDGVLTHRRVHEKRVLRASIGRGDNRQEVAPIAALKKAAELLKAAKGKIAVVLSAQRTTEENFALAHLAKNFLDVKELYLAKLPDWDGDEILRDDDRNPNVRGCKRAAGSTPLLPLSELAEPVVGQQVNVVLSLGGFTDGGDVTTIGALGQAKVVVVATNVAPLSELADVLLPTASWAEQDGSFVNRQDMEQRFEAGPRPAGDAIPGWEIVVRLARQLGHPIAWKTLKDVRAAMKSTGAPSASAPTPAAPAPAE
jgi:NADH-quinone oxidoreductase subunit G